MIVAVPEVLREVLGPEGARALAELLNQVGHEMRDDVIAIAEERFGRRLADELAGVRSGMNALESGFREDMATLETRLRAEMGTLRQDLTDLESGLRQDLTALDSGLRQDMSALEAKLSGDMGTLETRLSDRLNRAQTRLLRWNFVLWLGQFAVLLTILFTLVGA